jgi:hypothetical protein
MPLGAYRSVEMTAASASVAASSGYQRSLAITFHLSSNSLIAQQ